MLSRFLNELSGLGEPASSKFEEKQCTMQQASVVPCHFGMEMYATHPIKASISERTVSGRGRLETGKFRHVGRQPLRMSDVEAPSASERDPDVGVVNNPMEVREVVQLPKKDCLRCG